MSGVPVSTDRRVRQRARNRREYCGIAQEGQQATFHVDHVIPRRAFGPTGMENLALACVSCSLRKGARLEAADPLLGTNAPIFHPRRDRWEEHFEATPDFQIVGRTAIGRATVEALRMNRPIAVAIRREAGVAGKYPG